MEILQLPLIVIGATAAIIWAVLLIVVLIQWKGMK